MGGTQSVSGSIAGWHPPCTAGVIENPAPETPPTAQFWSDDAEPDPLRSKDVELFEFDQIAQSIAVTDPASEKSIPTGAEASSAIMHGCAGVDAFASARTLI